MGTLNQFSKDLEKMLGKFGLLHLFSNFKKHLKNLNEKIKIYMNAKKLLKKDGICIGGCKGNIQFRK